MDLITSERCSAASISMLTGRPLDYILADLFGDLEYPFPEPWQGMAKVPSMDEICQWMWDMRGEGLMPFNRDPVCSPHPKCPMVPVWRDGEAQWLRHLGYGPGLLEGVSANGGHMCAWDGEQVFDPRGSVYPWADRLTCGFEAERFWLLV
jgi:hypothetical protein